MLIAEHVISLLLIVVGSGLLIFGLARTSYANGGKAKVAANVVTATYRKLTHKPVVVYAGTASLGVSVGISASVSVTHDPPDAFLNDSAKIDRLWQIIKTMETNQNAVNKANDEQRERDLKEMREADKARQGEIADVRSELVVGLRKQALDGLALAALGAVFVAVGDIVGAVTAFAG